MLSGNEDDIDEIVSEVKPNKKVIKVSESDFEADVAHMHDKTKQMQKPSERDRDLRNSKKNWEIFKKTEPFPEKTWQFLRKLSLPEAWPPKTSEILSKKKPDIRVMPKQFTGGKPLDFLKYSAFYPSRKPLVENLHPLSSFVTSNLKLLTLFCG